VLIDIKTVHLIVNTSPPGPTGEPIFGSSRQYSSDPLRFITGVERAYNGIAAFEMGPMETYMITSPSVIDRILVGESEQFPKPDFQRDTLGELLGDGLLLSDGETWESQRKLASPAFAMSRLASFDERIARHARKLTARWEPGEQLDIEQEMTGVTIDVITDLMLGTDLSERQLTTLRDNLEPLGERFEPNPLRDALAQWAPMPSDREYQSAVSVVDGIVDDIIAERRGTEAREDEPMDLLSILLRAQTRGEQSDEQIRDEVVTMLLAGHDTTALTLTYTWYLLSEHPEKRIRIHEEVDAIDGIPTMADVQTFEYLEWTINEAMRLYPPVYTLFRETAADVDLLGYDVPAGSLLMLPQWAVHRSPNYWDDPDTFRPERWEPDRNRDRPRFAYFPFGGGPRHCIGKHLALLEAKLILATIAKQYALSYTGQRPLQLQPSLTLHPRNGMNMSVVER